MKRDSSAMGPESSRPNTAFRRPSPLALEGLEPRHCLSTVSLSGPATVAEGDAGSQSVVYEVALSTPMTTPASVRLTVAPITAASPADFVVPGGSTRLLRFAPGETRQTVILQVFGDVLRELDESFRLALSNPTNCSIGAGTIVTEVIDNDAYTFTVEPPATATQEGSVANVVIRLTSPATRAEYFTLRTGNGTALGGKDFVGIGAAVLVIPPGQSRVTATVQTLVDTASEGSESLWVYVKPRDSRLGAEAPATFAITDVAPPIPTVTVTAEDASANEAGLDTAIFRLTRSGDLSSPLTVSYTVSGSATSASDYQPLPGIVTFAAGQAVANITLNPIDDADAEPAETVVVSLATGTGYSIGTPAAATATIQSDEGPPTGIVVTIEASDNSAAEGTLDPGTLRFTRTGDLTTPLTVSFATAGSALPGIDYQQLGSTVTFAAGSATADMVVTPLEDSLLESAETVVASLEPGSGYTVGGTATATVTITSDDAWPADTVVLRGFQVTVVYTSDNVPAGTKTAFAQAVREWSTILQDAPDVVVGGSLVVDDFQLLVTFRDGPSAPATRPWQQPGFGGAWFAVRRPGVRGLPYRGELELTTEALTNPAFFTDRFRTDMNFYNGVGKVVELIGRALGFDLAMTREWGLIELIRTQTGFVRAVKNGTQAANVFRRLVVNNPSYVPVDWDSYNAGIVRWSSSYAASFSGDVFLNGWAASRRTSRTMIGAVTKALFADLGYAVR
jgi:hypothetical protein